jgi:hypothetical protein
MKIIIILLLVRLFNARSCGMCVLCVRLVWGDRVFEFVVQIKPFNGKEKVTCFSQSHWIKKRYFFMFESTDCSSFSTLLLSRRKKMMLHGSGVVVTASSMLLSLPSDRIGCSSWCCTCITDSDDPFTAYTHSQEMMDMLFNSFVRDRE